MIANWCRIPTIRQVEIWLTTNYKLPSPPRTLYSDILWQIIKTRFPNKRLLSLYWWRVAKNAALRLRSFKATVLSTSNLNLLPATPVQKHGPGWYQRSPVLGREVRVSNTQLTYPLDFHKLISIDLLTEDVTPNLIWSLDTWCCAWPQTLAMHLASETSVLAALSILPRNLSPKLALLSIITSRFFSISFDSILSLLQASG